MTRDEANKLCNHTAGQPAEWNVLRWYDYAERMSKTHTQERCPGCGLFKVWVPKAPKATKKAVEKFLRSMTP